MPIGNPAGYLNKAGSFARKVMSTTKGKATSSAIPKTVSGASSGAMSFAKNNRMAQYAMKNKGKSAAMGLGAASVGAYGLSGRRGRGVDKFAGGRPTGMYGR
jgi:hypothetical protein